MLSLLQEWLQPYAAFCFLRDLFGTADHSQWGLFAEFSQEKVMAFYYFATHTLPEDYFMSISESSISLTKIPYCASIVVLYSELAL